MAGCLLASVGAVTFDFAAHGILPTQDGQAWRWIASYCCQAGCSALYITVGATLFDERVNLRAPRTTTTEGVGRCVID
jgi:hypothetical protein